jgi:hypothetical protein
MRDLVEHTGVPSLRDVRALRLGRHFRLSPRAKAIVGRDEDENRRLRNELEEGDVFLEVEGMPGPLTLVRGEAGHEEIASAAAITSRYGKSGGRRRTGVLRTVVGGGSGVLVVDPVDRERVRSMMIGKAG